MHKRVPNLNLGKMTGSQQGSDMPGKYNHVQYAFNAGIMSPVTHSRSDFDKYAKGVAVCENFIVSNQGALIKRAGTHYVTEAKDVSALDAPIQLISFEDTNGTNYIIEFGLGYIRFFKEDGEIVMSGGSPFELANGLIFKVSVNTLQWVQSGDVLYMCIQFVGVYTITKTSTPDTSWSFDAVVFDWPPFNDENSSLTELLYSSATTGTVTITAVGHLPFNITHVNSLYIKFRENPESIHDLWVTGTVYAANAKVRFGENVYQTTAGGTSGTRPPVHQELSESDGGVTWTYLHSGEGYALVTGFTNAFTVTADVKRTLPASVVGVGNVTPRWAFSSWVFENGPPEAVCIYEDRLVFGGSKAFPNRIWGSVVGDYTNFKAGVSADDSYQYALSSNGNSLQYIRWLYGARQLLIGTDSSEDSADGSSSSSPITPTSVSITSHTSHGSSRHRPVRVGSTILFVQESNQQVRGLSFNFDVDSYIAPDITILAPGIFMPNIQHGVLQQFPQPVVWYPKYKHHTTSNEFLSLTFDQVENTYAWSKHKSTDDALVISMAVLRSATKEQVWLAVQRTIDGNDVRYIEYMNAPTGSETDIEDHFYVDCGITYDGASTSTITGLDHLEGETVKILADGLVQADKTVSSGQITLDTAATKAQIGLGYDAVMQTLPIDPNRTEIGLNARIDNVSIRVTETGDGLLLGGDSTNTDSISFFATGESVPSPIPLQTGLFGPYEFPVGYQRDPQIYIAHNQPYPCTLVGLSAEMVVYDK